MPGAEASGVVLAGGEIQAGDAVRVERPPQPHPLDRI